MKKLRLTLCLGGEPANIEFREYPKATAHEGLTKEGEALVKFLYDNVSSTVWDGIVKAVEERSDD